MFPVRKVIGHPIKKRFLGTLATSDGLDGKNTPIKKHVVDTEKLKLVVKFHVISLIYLGKHPGGALNTVQRIFSQDGMGNTRGPLNVDIGKSSDAKRIANLQKERDGSCHILTKTSALHKRDPGLDEIMAAIKLSKETVAL